MSAKYVIYTAMIGGYDNIKQPQVIDDRFDFVLFSNDIKEKKIGVWQVRPISYSNIDNTRICRYIKTHPEELLPEYEFSIWIDSNVRIMTDFIYSRSLQLYANNIQIASMNHLERNCIYEEAYTILECTLEYESIILDWCKLLRKEKYPLNNGLFETNVVYRINNNKVQIIDKFWWKCIDDYSRRDQLSFNYVLWKNDFKCEYILPNDINTNNSIHFDRLLHTNSKNRIVNYNGDIPWLIRYVNKVPKDREKIKSIYYRLYTLPFSNICSLLIGQIYRVKHFFMRKLFR